MVEEYNSSASENEYTQGNRNMNISIGSISNNEEVAEGLFAPPDNQKAELQQGITSFADTVRSTCSNTSETKKSLAPNFSPGPADVILARGKKAYNHAGNKWLRQLINKNLKAYSEAPTKLDKSFIVSKIMDTVRKTSNGGGFVRQDDGKWYEVGDRLAREKISQSFRDLLHTKYRSSTKAKARLKAKAKEHTEFSDRQHFGLNEYVQSGFVEPPTKRPAIQPSERAHGGLSSELGNPQPHTLHYATRNLENLAGSQPPQIGVIRRQPSDVNLYRVARRDPPTSNRAIDPQGSDISPLFSPQKIAPLSDQYDLAAGADFLDLGTAKMPADTALGQRMHRPFLPTFDEDSDMQTIDWLPEEEAQLPRSGSDGIDSSLWEDDTSPLKDGDKKRSPEAKGT